MEKRSSAMLSTLLLLLVAIVCQVDKVQGSENDTTSPGISMSLDFQLINQFKNTHMSSIIQQFNGMKIEDVNLGAEGHINSNKVFVKLRNQDIELVANETVNSYSIKLRNFYIFIRSQDFKYNMWFVPIKATLDIEVAEVDLEFEIELRNASVNWVNPQGGNETRIVP